MALFSAAAVASASSRLNRDNGTRDAGVTKGACGQSVPENVAKYRWTSRGTPSIKIHLKRVLLFVEQRYILMRSAHLSG